MGLFTTIKKKEDEMDDRTVDASDYFERMAKLQRERNQLKDVPYTEMPKE